MRPEAGKLVMNQEVIVVCSANDSRRRAPEDRYVRAEIVKLGPVWVALAGPGLRDQWRMRKDTQREDSQYFGDNASFRTLEQHAWHQRQDEARKFLREQGLTIQDSWSPWRGREVELADLIRGGLSLTREEASRENWARSHVGPR